MGAKTVPVCRSGELGEKCFVIVDIDYCGKPHSAIVLRYEGQVYAYLNECVHMPKRLNCERDTVFDADRQLLRCSMHGIVYHPKTGECQSAICQGENLTMFQAYESDGQVSLKHRHLSSPFAPANDLRPSAK